MKSDTAFILAIIPICIFIFCALVFVLVCLVGMMLDGDLLYPSLILGVITLFIWVFYWLSKSIELEEREEMI